MSKGETLRAFVNERLTAAAEEIFALVEKTIAEYEVELCRSKEENQRKQQLLDEALAPPPVLEEVPQISAESIDVEIQTETRSGESIDNWGFAQPPHDITRFIVKRENDDTDNENTALSPLMDTVTEVCFQDNLMLPPDTPPEITNPAHQPVNTRSRLDLSKQHETEKSPKASTDKRKLGRPRRLVVTPEKLRDQPSKQAKEKPVEPKRTERRGEKPEARPTRSPQKTQTIEIARNSPRKRDLQRTPVQSKCPKSKRPKSKRPSPKIPSPKREYRKSKNVLETLGDFLSDKKASPGIFRCSSCDRAFTRLHHLERHVLIHTDERSFPCTMCDKSFRLKQHLMSHMDIHSEERRYGCPVCNKKFKRRDNLGRHILVHSGLRPFACPQCDVQFSLKKNLERHMVVHSRAELWCCSFCNMRFSSPFYYNRHVKTHL